MSRHFSQFLFLFWLCLYLTGPIVETFDYWDSPREEMSDMKRQHARVVDEHIRSLQETTAQESKARVTLCHIIPERMGACAESLRNAFLDELNCMIPEEVREWCSPECVVQQGEAPATILKLANDGRADLIVLGVRPAIHMRTHAPAGVTYKILAAAQCPVLTIRGNAEFPWNGFFG